MPSAKPLTITTPFFESFPARSLAVSRPSDDACREPMIPTLGRGSGISIGPIVKSLGGEYFLSTSLSRPNNSSGDNATIFGGFRVGIRLTWRDTSIILSLHRLVAAILCFPTCASNLWRGNNTTLFKKEDD